MLCTRRAPKIPNPMWPLAWAYDTPGRLSSSRMARGMAYNTPPAASTAASNLQRAMEQGCSAGQGERRFEAGKGRRIAAGVRSAGPATLSLCSTPHLAWLSLFQRMRSPRSSSAGRGQRGAPQ